MSMRTTCGHVLVQRACASRRRDCTTVRPRIRVRIYKSRESSACRRLYSAKTIQRKLFTAKSVDSHLPGKMLANILPQLLFGAVAVSVVTTLASAAATRRKFCQVVFIIKKGQNN